jgi:hypothetical protein
MAEIGIGSTVWVFDENHRVYARDANGRAPGGPIYREHWVPVTITSETRVSWVINRWDKKLPKKRPAGYRPRYCVSQAEIDEECWADDYRYAIVRHVEWCDPATLRKVAELVGYKPEGAR